MRSKLSAVSICLFFGAALTSTNLVADSLSFPNTIVVSGTQAARIEGQLTISTDYAILSNTAFASSTQGEGTYTDLVGPTFTVDEPGFTSDLTLGSFQFAAGIPRNTQVNGTLSLFYTLYSVNPVSPAFDPIADYVSNDDVSASETFIDNQSNAGPPLQAAVSEPGSWALAAAGLLVVSGASLRKTRMTPSRPVVLVFGPSLFPASLCAPNAHQLVRTAAATR